MEKTLERPMFDIPSDKNILECIVRAEHVGGKTYPEMRRKHVKIRSNGKRSPKTTSVLGESVNPMSSLSASPGSGKSARDKR